MPQENPSPTIYDVARISGFSVSTISRVLNNPEKVNDKTRDKILAAIEDLGFVPKAEARARAIRGTKRIGVLTPFFTAPSFVQRLRGIAGVLGGTSFEMVIYPVQTFAELDSYMASLPLVGNLDGLIIMSLRLTNNHVERLNNYGLTTVSIEFSHKDLNTVEIDDKHGGRIAANFLLQRGHHRIAFLGDTDLPDYGIDPVRTRFAGFRQALEEAGEHLPDEYVVLAAFSQDRTRQAARALLTGSKPPTAIFAATDFQALGILKVARELGLQVPGDLAVLGFDDLDMAEMMDLTTIRQPLDESGEVSVELLLSQIKKSTRVKQHIQLPLTLVERKTV